ncbi:MAG: site-2 protease family protein [bacterium]|nr:site-2 protease family protein [bacterium]
MDSQILLVIFQLAVLIFSVIIHEVSHGAVAERLGDPTARLAGRLTLNPLAHISFFGMVIFPILSYLAWGIPVGGAKPVPYNPYNLKNPAQGGAMIAAAGPLSNFLIALVFGILIRIISVAGSPALLTLSPFFRSIVYLNILLGVFNLVPIPPLDGSKVLNFFLPARWQIAVNGFWTRALGLIQNNWLLSLIIFIFFFQYVLAGVFFVIEPIIRTLYFFLTGQYFGF